MHRTDAPGSSSGLFSDGDPYGSPPRGGAIVSADWLNDVQENLAQAIEAAGITLEKGNGGQLLEAILQLARDANFTGRTSRAQARNGQTTFDLFGLGAPTALGTISQSGNADGFYLQAQTTTPSTTPEDVGWYWGFNETRRDQIPDLEWTIECGQVSNSRLWSGLFSANPSTLQNPSSITCAAFRFDHSLDGTGAGGDGTIKSVTSNGSGSTIKSTGIAFNAIQRYRPRVRRSVSLAGRFEFFLDGVLVATHENAAEFVPAPSTAIGPAFLLRHLSDTSNKNVRVGWASLRSK
jgi:hypothetical protein